MKEYRITYIANTEMCKINPHKDGCLRTEIIQADSKTNAILTFHSSFDFMPEQEYRHGKKLSGGHNIMPMVWEVTENKKVL